MTRRGKRNRQRRTKAEQKAVLASPASPHNDPLVRAMYEDLPTMTNAEAAELGLAIQRVVRGENLDDTDPEAARLYRQFMAQADKASSQWDNNRRKLIEDSYNEANIPSEKDAVRMREELKTRYAVIKEDVRLNSSQKKQLMIDHIKNGPFEEMYVEPKILMGRQGDNQVTAVEGQIIGLCGVQLYLKPGKSMVPTRYAERYRQILRSEKETLARKEVLMGKGIDPSGGPDGKDGYEQVADRMHEINRESGSSSGGGEAGDNWLDPSLYQRY